MRPSSEHPCVSRTRGLASVGTAFRRISTACSLAFPWKPRRYPRVPSIAAWIPRGRLASDGMARSMGPQHLAVRMTDSGVAEPPGDALEVCAGCLRLRYALASHDSPRFDPHRARFCSDRLQPRAYRSESARPCCGYLFGTPDTKAAGSLEFERCRCSIEQRFIGNIAAGLVALRRFSCGKQ